MQLIQAGANIHHISSKGPNNGTALHECAANGSEKIAQMLIDIGSDPFLEDVKGELTPSFSDASSLYLCGK